MSKILVCSPHLDDAVLSCCDHIYAWQKAGHDVSVVSVFTSFFSAYPSSRARAYMVQSGFDSVMKFERHRKKEDTQAMRSLGVSWFHLGFIDAAFRANKKLPLYPANKTVFGGAIHPADAFLVEKVAMRIKKLGVFDLVVGPLGIGYHVDHTLAKKALSQIFQAHKIWYFVDFPYALHFENWTWKLVKKILFSKKSVKTSSGKKWEILKCYATQTPLFFDSRPNYPEVIVYP